MIDGIINRISNKEQLITRLLGYFTESERKYEGLTKCVDSVLDNPNEANTRKMLNTTMKIVRDQMKINQDVLAYVVMCASDNDFTSKQANFAIKTGSKAEDVLSEMIRGKFRK